MAERVLQFGVPKGSLQDATVELFRSRGFTDVRADRDIARIERVVSGIVA